MQPWAKTDVFCCVTKTLAASSNPIMLDLLLRAALGVAVLYLMFWVLWFQKHIDTLQYLLKGRDKKWSPVDGTSTPLTRGGLYLC